MHTLQRMIGVLKKIASGKDPLLVQQEKEQWDAQFAKGRWDRLTTAQPNTTYIAEQIIAKSASTNIRVLDVGCGNGGLAKLLAPHTKRITYTGVDISDVAITHAQTLFPEGTFQTMDASSPAQDLGIFDVIVFNEVFYYMHPNEVLPRYKKHTHADTLCIISMIRSWRSPFIWRRVDTCIQNKKMIRIDATEGTKHIWDICTCTFK